MTEADTNQRPADGAAETKPDGARAAKAPSPPRAMLVAEGEADALVGRLEAAGVEVLHTALEAAPRAAAELAPAAVLLAFGAREAEPRLVALARRLRNEPRTHAVPLVFLFRTDERTLRSAAQHVGADDYFAQNASAEELRARLSALFWRAEAGRRAAPSGGDRRSEIDNFIFLVETVGADAAQGSRGAVALAEARGRGGDASRALAAAHGFLKLNLRRRDAVAFYGPATLIIYLPGMDARGARDTLSRLGEELKAAHGCELAAGVASFPADGAEAEGLVEKAQAALLAASRAHAPAPRVYAYGEEEQDSKAASFPPPARTPAHERTQPTATPPAPPAAAEATAGAHAAEPNAPSEDDGKRPAHAVEGAPNQPPRGRARRLMLAVSDAERMAQVNLLARSAGYEVRAAFDGQHALGLLRIDRPDLLLLDYDLRGMDGVETLRRLAKQSGASGPPPTVLLLPEGREELRGEATRAGARRVVPLPYDPVELLDALRETEETE